MLALAPNATRDRVLAFIEAFPGEHLRAVERGTRLPLGQVLYHLDRLERAGTVVSIRGGGYRRFFLAASVGRSEKRYLAALRSPTPRAIALELLERGPLTHKDIQAALGLAGSTTSFHLQRLAEAGIVAGERVGGQILHRVEDSALARFVLVFWRESFRDAAVDRFVRRALDGVRQPASFPAASGVPSAIAP